MTSNTAPIKWAQRSDSLYLTIALPDVKDETINLTDSELTFKGKSGGKDYEVTIAFFEKVDSEGSTYKVLPRSVQFLINKKVDEEAEADAEFWPRLLQDKALEKNQVKIDWDRYVDEDEEGEGFDTSNMEGGQGMGGMPPGMGGMGGMPPGMGGMGGMPGMEGMGGMPGMGGMGGMPGMEGMGGMPGMGGMGGMPGMEGMDMEALMKQMGGMGGGMPGGEGGPDFGDSKDGDDDGDDDDDLPELEEAA
eukprot:CAMPEP_0198137138 /NCGR_PEP_ID=MMETSP1443-20131203/670_1 /TAXON_ID=186043 /ORGANISM="Entomoneis sp., Strain CCMP2396" /LENGTH=247 /DNA_ID=CAMNT_0043798473 /DNA_START=107 /DNA_END=850 /DNA_ORIENTATION=+